MSKSIVKVLVLRSAGTNCNEEMAYAFGFLGAEVHQVHISALVKGDVKLSDYHIMGLPGGFSYGDDLGSGRILANELSLRLSKEISAFVKAGKLVLGVCNGFQVLVKAGLLPALGNKDSQEATLFYNDSGKFEDRWVHLATGRSRCVWTKDLPEHMFLPVAHGEGKFIPKDNRILQQLKDNGQIAFTYCTADGSDPAYPENPNGSVGHIAGICDTTGRILGLMPHPERHFTFEHHPFWTRLKDRRQKLGEGAAVFANGIQYVKDHLRL